MADAGHEETEKILKRLEKEIAEEYAKAEKEIWDKYVRYLNTFARDEADKLDLYKQGLITEEEYMKWRLRQVTVNNRWNVILDSIAEDVSKTNQMAKSIAFGYMPEIYAVNFNYGTYQVEMASGVDTSFPYLYDRNAVERLFRGGEFVHAPGQAITDKINMKKDLAWSKKQVRSVMLQGIIQGESIPNMATRYLKEVGGSYTEEDIKNRNNKTAEQIAEELERKNRNAAVRNVRTMATGVQNAGRVDSYKRAEGMGIDLQQEWLATLDGRTRHAHRLLDGQRADVGDKFEVNGDKIEYPGDPSAKGYLVYNCRCTLVPVLKGFEVDSTDMSLRNTDHMPDNMTYEQWKIAKYPKPPKKPVAMTKEMIDNEYKEWQKRMIDKAINGGQTNDAVLRAIGRGVLRRDVKRLATPLTQRQIINKVGGKDDTKGSCISSAWAYLGNKFGYDVRDFRGGESRKSFASREDSTMKIAEIAGIGKGAWTDKQKDDFKAANALLTKMKIGKEYMLATGRHGAIVRKTEKGYEYLELQSYSPKNGFKPLDDKVLKERFGCKKGLGGKRERENVLIDTDYLEKSDDFRECLEYINTPINEQKKR